MRIKYIIIYLNYCKRLINNKYIIIFMMFNNMFMIINYLNINNIKIFLMCIIFIIIIIAIELRYIYLNSIAIINSFIVVKIF